jgi:uncharacterized repeat protein (TIGR01451 family)
MKKNLLSRTALTVLVVLTALFLPQSRTAAQVFGCQAGFNYSVDTTVFPMTVTMTDSSWVQTGSIINYHWTYNGSQVGGNNASQTISLNSVQNWDTLCLTITTDSGCTNTFCQLIQLGPPCHGSVGFSFTHDSLRNYFFTPVTSGFTLPITYSWTATNGASSTSSTFTTQFATAGTYTVCLTVADANGCSATHCQSVTVQNGTQCAGCTPHIYFQHDSLNPNLFIFHDTTTYLATPTYDEWFLNGVSQGSGSMVTAQLTASGSTYAMCRVVNVPGCDSTCTVACLNIGPSQIPGIHVNYFDMDSSVTLCMTPAIVPLYIYGNITGYAIGDTVHLYVNFDDGTDTTLHLVNIQNYFYATLMHTYANSGTYTPVVIASTPDYLYSDTALIGQTIIVSNSCGPVTGTVYLDNNQNCVFDAGDQPLSHRMVRITDGGALTIYAFTDAGGHYGFSVPTGTTYTVTVDTAGNWYSSGYHVVCPSGATLTGVTVPSAANNFFLVCPTGFDLSVTLTGWGFVPGRTGRICVYAHDSRCAHPNGQVQLILDPLLTAVPDTSGHYTVSGDTVTWNIGGASGNSYYYSLCVPVVTSTSATIGDTVCATATILPIVGDSVPSNNIAVYCWGVRSSWDPNDKAADPEGAGVNHAIRPETELTYTIRFQNTGTAPAQDVFILDTLDAGLDVNSLEVLASSHPTVPAVLAGNILRFSFDGINLPDSTTNEPLSHGYVVYRVSPVSGIANGSVINNSAAIFFDFNPPVLTNVVMRTIDITLGIHDPAVPGDVATLFPNPASQSVTVQLHKAGKADVRLFDIAGRMVAHAELSRSGPVDVHALPAGIYKVQVAQEQVVQHVSLVIVR